MRAGTLAYIDTPAQGNRRPPGLIWVCDNGAFSDKFDETKWWRFLTANAYAAADCLFAVAPDVVGDHAATLARSLPWLPKIRALGYPAAFVLQDGASADTIPWDDFDALFIGGSTEYKLGAAAREIAAEAKRRGKWLHVGRVNSKRRFDYAGAAYELGGLGADSCDGTFLVYGPTVNLPKLLSWTHPDLFGGAA
jgi:hypothetical protein